MKVSVYISRDGRIESSTILPDEARPIYFTPAAEAIMRQSLTDHHAFCSKCAIAVVIKELSDGVCMEGTGCQLDVDTDIFDLPNPDQAIALRGLATRLYATAKKVLLAMEARDVYVHND
jgi:hypothetical protein